MPRVFDASSRNGVMLCLPDKPNLAACVSDSEITMAVEHIDGHAEHVGRGAPIEMTIRGEPWGAREYRVGLRPAFSSEPDN